MIVNSAPMGSTSDLADIAGLAVLAASTVASRRRDGDRLLPNQALMVGLPARRLRTSTRSASSLSSRSGPSAEQTSQTTISPAEDSGRGDRLLIALVLATGAKTRPGPLRRGPAAAQWAQGARRAKERHTSRGRSACSG